MLICAHAFASAPPPPPPPPGARTRFSDELERPSEFDFGAAPEVGEDVYLVFSQLTTEEFLVYEELLR